MTAQRPMAGDQQLTASSRTASGLRRYRTFVFDNARWDDVPLRWDDVLVTTPAKTGTTWLQTICVMLVLGPPPWGRPLTDISPWLDMNLEPIADVRSRIEAQSHRRVIKSHTPLDGLPHRPGVRYLIIGRDPRDVALSSHGHVNNLDLAQIAHARFTAVGADDLPELGIDPAEPPAFPDDPVESFRQYLDNDELALDTGSLLGFAHTMTQAWEARDRDDIKLLHYADLRADLAGQIREIARFLDIDLSAARLASLVEAAGVDAMRSRASDLVPAVRTGIWQDTTAFFAQGRLGDWRDLPADVLDHYDQRAAELFPADLRRWLERS